MSKFDKKMKLAISKWESLASVLTAPTTESEYDALIERVDTLLDYLGDDEKHPLNGFLHLMGEPIAEYDKNHFNNAPSATGVQMLEHLMNENDITQSDLPEVGSQGVVSEILGGKRELNIRQVKALANRFDVPPSCFL